MFLCVQKPLFWQCLQLLCEVSSLDLAFWGRGTPSGACWVWRAAAVSGTFLNPWGKVGERLVWVLVFPVLPILHLFPPLYLVPFLVILLLASVSILAVCDGAEMT